MPNRFSQIVQPYVANPIDVNMFAMVPLAKARAKAMGIKAAESYMFDYSIDQKDAAYINPLVKGVTDQKDAIVNRVRTEGVSNDLVSDLIQTKRNYDKVQTDVRKAEENKKRIDAWSNKLLVLHKNNPTYMDFVKNKEYGRGWKGTFGENGSINTFDASYGPQYFDMTAGYENALKGIRMELDKETLGGGYITTIPDPATGGTLSMFVSSQGSKTFSNKSRVLAQLEILKEKYKDPTTTEGAYAAYIGMTPGAIDKMGTDIANRMIETETKRGAVSRRLLAAPTPPSASDLTDPTTPDDKIPGNVFPVETKTEVGHSKKLTEFNKDKYVKNTVYNLWDWPRAVWAGVKTFGDEYSKAKEEDDTWYGNMNTYALSAAKNVWSALKAKRIDMDSDMAAFNKMSEAEKINRTAKYVSKFTLDYLSKEGINQKFADNRTLANGLQIVNKDKIERDFDEAAGSLIYNKGRDVEGNEDLTDGIVDFYTKTASTTRQYTFNQSESSPLATTKGFKNNPKAYIEYFATQADMLTGNISVKNLATGRLINPSTEEGQKLLQKIEGAMRTFSGAEGADPDSDIFMDFHGVGTSEPGLYNVYDENIGANVYSEKLAYGAKVKLFRNIKKGNKTVKVQIGQFLIGNTANDRTDGNFKSLSNKMEKMGNLKYNEVLDVQFAKRQGLEEGSEQYVNAEVHRNTFERQGLDKNGNLVIIPKGQIMYYIEGEDLPRWYNAGDIGFFKIPTGAKAKLWGNFGLKEVADNAISAMSPETFTHVMSNTKSSYSNHGRLY